MKKKSLIGAVAGIVLLVGSFGVTRFVFSNVSSMPEGLSYTRDAYISSCRYWAKQENGVAELGDAIINQYCGCVYDDGVKQYGKEEFAKMDGAASETNSVTPEVNALVNTCLEQVFGAQ
jgi:hypothetical protein